MGINVAAADFAGFQLSAPLGTDSKGHMLVTAGDTISLTVKARDAFGNIITDYNGMVNFTSTDTQAGLPADYTFTAADGGVHTFTVALKTVTPNGVVWSFSVVDAANAATLATMTNFEVTNAAAAVFVRQRSVEDHGRHAVCLQGVCPRRLRQSREELLRHDPLQQYRR